ncbi:MAG UNVERIFIED_CONTAM: hypothetical protein LVR29_11440 [Microcystis novacekii LVE1205-3]
MAKKVPKPFSSKASTDIQPALSIEKIATALQLEPTKVQETARLSSLD